MKIPQECWSVVCRTKNGKSLWYPALLSAEKTLFDGWVWRLYHVCTGKPCVSRTQAATESQLIATEQEVPYFGDAIHMQVITENQKRRGDSNAESA